MPRPRGCSHWKVPMNKSMVSKNCCINSMPNKGYSQNKGYCMKMLKNSLSIMKNSQIIQTLWKIIRSKVMRRHILNIKKMHYRTKDNDPNHTKNSYPVSSLTTRFRANKHSLTENLVFPCSHRYEVGFFLNKFINNLWT